MNGQGIGQTGRQGRGNGGMGRGGGKVQGECRRIAAVGAPEGGAMNGREIADAVQDVKALGSSQQDAEGTALEADEPRNGGAGRGACQGLRRRDGSCRQK